MKVYTHFKKMFLVCCLFFSMTVFMAAQANQKTVDDVAPRTDLPPLPIEKTGNVRVLPSEFPETWMFVDESSFMSMFGGKMILLDVAESKHADRIKGTADKNLLGNFIQAKTRPEFYIMESFHSRGARGPKTDVLTIYNKTTMATSKEIIWPDTRLQSLPRRHAMALTPDEKFLFVANFSPAASITVVDLDTKEITATIGTPGCVLTFATGKRSVSSLCSNGGMLTTVLNESGKLKSQHRIKAFFDTDKTPIFERPVIINEIAYFPSFTGEVHVFDFSGEVAKYLEHWSLVTEDEKKKNWRPGGLVLNDTDEQGIMYQIMHPDGYDGSQTHGGSQVWLFDMQTKQRLKVIDIPSWAVSIGVTRGEKPLMVITNAELQLDVYNPRTGKLIQTISDFGNHTPLLVHKAY